MSARARRVHLREAIEDAFEVLGRDAAARVGNDEARAAVRRGFPEDLDPSSRLGELERVADQVHEHLLERVGIGTERRQLRQAAHLQGDPFALGVISGLTLDSDFDSLCRLYWRTCVSIALGVRHILETLNTRGYSIDTLHITGGHTRNPLLMELYADATFCTVVEPSTPDATLLGMAMVAANAAGLYPTLDQACLAMQQGGTSRTPNPAARTQFDRDYRIFLEMIRQRRVIDELE